MRRNSHCIQFALVRLSPGSFPWPLLPCGHRVIDRRRRLMLLLFLLLLRKGCNRKDTHAWHGKSRRRAPPTGPARTQKPSHVHELGRIKHQNQEVAAPGERGPLARIFRAATWQEREAASMNQTRSGCSVLEASRAADSGPTTQGQVLMPRVSRVGGTRAAN